MNIIIRVDASNQIGTGHVIRCLTLAKEFNKIGNNVVFICRELDGNYIHYIEKEGFKVKLLPNIKEDMSDVEWTRYQWEKDVDESTEVVRGLGLEVDLIIVDHYGIDENWEKKMLNKTKKLMVIDDLANRKHYCNLILDMGFSASRGNYSKLISESTEGLFGVKYSLLREQFRHNRKKKFYYNYECIKIHIFFGGKDTENYTSLYSELILKNFPNVEILAVVSESFKFLSSLKKLSKDYSNRFKWKYNVKNMALTMKECNLGLGAPGSTTWERACIGLPSAYLSTNENQILILKKLESKSFCKYIGEAKNISEDKFILNFDNFIRSQTSLNEMYYNGINFVDGYGTQRVVNYINKKGRQNCD